MTADTLMIAVGVFGLVLCVGYLGLVAFDRYSIQLDARLRELPAASGTLAAQDKARWRSGRRPISLSKSMTKLLPDSVQDRRLYQFRLMQAGIYSPAALSIYFAIKLVCMIVPPGLAILAGWLQLIDINRAVLIGCAMGAVGIFVPSFWLDRAIRRRHVVLRRSLADFLDLMIVCLDSGLSLQGSIQRVGDELRIAHPVFAGELSIVQRDIELGATINAAIRRFADRCGYEGIKVLGALVRESQRFGTTLAEAFRIQADSLRLQREQIAEELAQKASVKVLLPTLLLILPAVFVVVAGPAVIQIQAMFTK